MLHPDPITSGVNGNVNVAMESGALFARKFDLEVRAVPSLSESQQPASPAPTFPHSQSLRLRTLLVADVERGGTAACFFFPFSAEAFLSLTCFSRHRVPYALAPNRVFFKQVCP